MSRSYRKHAITGMTVSESEKKDKQLYNRRLRRKNRQLLKMKPDDTYIPIIKKDVSSPWLMPKDGKIVWSWRKPLEVKCEECAYRLACLVGGQREECREKYNERRYKEMIRK